MPFSHFSKTQNSQLSGFHTVSNVSTDHRKYRIRKNLRIISKPEANGNRRSHNADAAPPQLIHFIIIT